MGVQEIEKGLGKLKLTRKAPAVAEKVKPALPSGKPLATAQEPKVTLKPQRMYGNVQGVGKRGEWKTIDQRELSASRARRSQRRGKAAVVAGGTTAVTAYVAGHDKGTMTVVGNRNRAWEEAGRLRGGSKLLRAAQGVSLGEKASFAARAIGKNPLGAALIGGAAVAGAGGVGYGQGKVREGYHQSRINARRKANMKRGVGKRAPMDHEASGFARYGDGSTKGKRLPDEFTKAETISKRIRNKDAEDDRQRRLGMGVAATAVGSGLLLRRGLGGAIKTTRSVRQAEVMTPEWRKIGDPARDFFRSHNKDGHKIPRKGVAIMPRQLAETAGGTALGAGALGLEHYSRGQRNRRWE